jgi:beta-glucosidase
MNHVPHHPGAPLYRDPSQSIDDRVRDLIEHMTLDEKLGQLGSAWIFQLADAGGAHADWIARVAPHGLGHVTRASGASSYSARDATRVANEIQRHLVEHTRLGLPAILHEEICSGLMAREATAFPQALGVAATFDPALNRRLADAVRTQMRAMGTHQGLSPVLDVCRDPRWGRTEETYGEDPALVAAMGVAFVTGLQGDDLASGVVATAKHFVGYGASEGGLNWAPAHLTERELRDVYLRPFEAAVRDADLQSVMNAYNEIDGMPCGANRWLMHEVLRGEWGFDGTVVSDYFSVKQLFEYHHVTDSASAAAALALRSGIDVELPHTECYSHELTAAIDRGLIAMADVDAAVARALTAKFRLGIIDRPYVDEGAVHLQVRTSEQLDLAQQIAADSLVLLSNDGVLPLDPALRRVAVIGPNAASARAMLGDYSYITHVESLVEVLRSGNNVFAMPIDHGVDVDEHTDLGHVTNVFDELVLLRPDADVRHAAGCTVMGTDRSGFDEAVELAAASDVAVMVMGDRSGLTEDCTTGESRDVASLDLPGVQEDLVLAVARTGTPVVLVIVGGRPIGSPEVHAAAAAVLMAWLPGERGGSAVADALCGRTSPGGKLPISYPRSAGQIPVFHGHKVSGGRSHWKGSYVDLSNEPLHPFGFGLGYTTFDLVVEPIAERSIAPGETVEVRVSVTNTGDVHGSEVVQLYSRDPVASVTRPVRELQAFARVRLEPGQAATVSLPLAADALGFTGRDMRFGVEPGDIELLVGTSSADARPVATVVIAGDAPVAVVRPPMPTPEIAIHPPAPASASTGEEPH